MLGVGGFILWWVCSDVQWGWLDMDACFHQAVCVCWLHYWGANGRVLRIRSGIRLFVSRVASAINPLIVYRPVFTVNRLVWWPIVFTGCSGIPWICEVLSVSLYCRRWKNKLTIHKHVAVEYLLLDLVCKGHTDDHATNFEQSGGPIYLSILGNYCVLSGVWNVNSPRVSRDIHNVLHKRASHISE